MPIINKGIFDTNDAFLRQTGNDWPTAQIISTSDVVESTSNLYFTTARVASNVATLMKSFQGSGLTIDAANGQININTVAASVPQLANVANTVISLAGHTTTEINEGSNLYFTTARVNATVQPFLTTANVVETSGNLYFTTARVNATVQPFLTTANVIETSSNLYFTTARANAAIWPSLTAANIANFVSTVNATVQPFLTTANVIETAGNLYFTTARVNATIQPFLTTANVVETSGNLYFTTARVAANVTTLLKSFQGSGLTIDAANGQINIVATSGVGTANVANFASIANVANTVISLAGHTTSEIIEGSNLYYTDARVNVAVRPILTTANVIETSGNLYFTTARANSAIWPSLTAANIANFASTVNTTVQPFLTTANVIETSSNLYFTTARVNTTIQPFLTTANVIETSSNLYFTTARVASNVTTLLKSFQGSGLTIDAANGQINIIASGGGGSSNVANTVISLAGHTTTEIIEGSNLYYTNARVLVGITTGTVVGNISITNTLTSNTLVANIATIGSGTGGSVTGANLVSAIYIQANSWLGLYAENVANFASTVNATIQPFLTAANIANFVSTVNVTVRPFLTTANVIETAGNLYFTTARVNATVQPFLTTANVIETSGNLYFTTARVAANVTTLLKSFQGSGLTIDAANGQINIIASGGGGNANVANTVISLAGHTTTEIIEGSNLYYTDARVNVAIRPILTTANVTETASNLYFTTARANAALWPSLTTANVIETSGNLYFTTARVNATVQPFLTTANVIETAGNLYFTAARVNTVIQPFLTTANVIETSGNLYFTYARVNTTIQPFLTTANVTESASNLYFTNSRVVSALQAGDNITIYANGRIDASAYSSIMVSESRTIISTGNASYLLGTSTTDPKRILVAIEGVIQIPITDYNVDGTYITFDSGPPIGANIEIKYFGTEYLQLSTTSALQSKVDSFIANSSILTYTLSLTPPGKDYISVVLNGNTLPVASYSLSTNRVTLAFAPQMGANLDIRSISGKSGSIFNTRNYVGTGSANTFGISAGFNQDNILVFENGVAQMPGTDYSVVNNNLVFVVPPVANVSIQIRELAIPVTNTIANVLPAFRGYDFVSGNILPSNGTRNLGNTTSYWNAVYANSFFIGTQYTPPTSSSTGYPGQMTYDSGYIYICVATNTWKRATLNTW